MAASILHLSISSKFPTLHSHLYLPSPSALPLSPTKPRLVRNGLEVSNFTISAPNSSVKECDEKIGTTQNDAVDNLRYVLAAGGTGGRIYPAVAIADELRNKNHSCNILFIGAPNSMESKAIPSSGYNFTSIPLFKLAQPIICPKNLHIPYLFIKSLVQCYAQLKDFDPQVVVGTGGFVAFPVCLAAKVKGIKLVIQEQNSVPGFANWALSFFADLIFAAFNSTVNSFPKNKCVVCGNPVRLSLRKFVSKAVARLHFFPLTGKTRDCEAKILLVLGGSFGAHAINIAMLNLYYQLLMQNKKLFLIWQTGVETYDEMDSLVKGHPCLYMSRFMHSIDMAYAAADLVVSRSGAMTCHEILATGKPSILIPSPDVSEGHQFENATLMADLAGCTVITEDELDSTTLAVAIQEILGDESKMADMSQRALKASKPDASAQMAHHIVSLANLSTKKNGQ